MIGPRGAPFAYVMFNDQREAIPYGLPDLEGDYQGIWYPRPPHSPPPYAGFEETSTNLQSSDWYYGAPYDPVNTSSGTTQMDYVGDVSNRGLRGRAFRTTAGGWTIGYWTKNDTTGVVSAAGTFTYGGTLATFQRNDGSGPVTAYYADFQWSAPEGSHGLLRMQDGILTSEHAAWSDPNHASWQYSYEAGVTNPYWGYDTHLISGPSGDVASIAKFEPYNPRWRTPGHKWSNVFFGGNVHVWGDKGGFFWRMSQDRQSYFLADKIGVHFVDYGTKDTIYTWRHPKQPGDWFECEVSGAYLNPYSRDQALGGSNTYDEPPPFTDRRNVDCTIHGLLDFANATTKMVFSYYDLNFIDSYGDDFVAVKLEVDANGKISAMPRYDLSPPNGSADAFFTVMPGPGDAVTAIVQEDSTAWAGADEWSKLHTYTIESDDRAKHSVIADSTVSGVGVENVSFHAAGMSHHQPVVVVSYWKYPSTYNMYTLWLDEVEPPAPPAPAYPPLTAGLRKPPSARNPEFAPGRQSRAIQTMVPGSLQGRVTNASLTGRGAGALTATAGGVGTIPDIVFSHDGAPVVGVPSGPYLVTGTPVKIVRVTAALGAVGSTGTTVEVMKNGSTLTTVTIPAGQMSVTTAAELTLAVNDIIKVMATSAGQGAAGLTVQLQTTL